MSVFFGKKFKKIAKRFAFAHASSTLFPYLTAW